MYPSGSGGPLYTPRTRKHILENFSPTGLHVLVVDDDLLCLKVLERMLKQCHYKVTTCNEVNGALKILREKEKEFDLVISDVYMPDEDGFKLLEVIGLELDLPVIMISTNSDINIVMKGILHGACDYLIKPVRIEELRNIWQHVIRRKGKEFGRLDPQEEANTDPRASESREEVLRKRKEVLEIPEVGMEEISSSPKKPRVNWSQQLHQQFVSAVNQLGVDNAVPRKILEIMNVEGLSRENVASHLQKYRLYLKRLSGAIPEPFPVASFQASEDGTPGGSMLVRPGRRGSEPSAGVKGLNLGAGLSSKSGKGNTLDSGTKKSLSQLKSTQQKQAANRAQVLSAIGVQGLPYDPSCSSGGLLRMGSLDLGFLAQATNSSKSSSSGAPFVKVLDDLARFNINRTIKLEDDIVLPAPALGECTRAQSSMEPVSVITGHDKKQGGRISSPINIRGPVCMQDMVEETMKHEGDLMLSSSNQDGNIAYGLASSLFNVPACQATARWSSCGELSERNYDQHELQPIQEDATKVGLSGEEASENTDMSIKQSFEPSPGSTVTETSGETFSGCSFEAIIEDLGIIPQGQQHVAVQQTNSDLLDVDEYLQLD